MFGFFSEQPLPLGALRFFFPDLAVAGFTAAFHKGQSLLQPAAVAVGPGSCGTALIPPFQGFLQVRPPVKLSPPLGLARGGGGQAAEDIGGLRFSIHPAGQGLPLADQALVGDVHRRVLLEVFGGEHQEIALFFPELFDDLPDLFRGSLADVGDLLEVGRAADAAVGGVGFGEGLEEEPGNFFFLHIQFLQRFFSMLTEGPAHSVGRFVVGHVDRPGGVFRPGGVGAHQGVLQDREVVAGAHVLVEQAVEQAGGDGGPAQAHRPGDRLPALATGEAGHQVLAAVHRLRQPGEGVAVAQEV